jgi:hypothetical protein
MTGAPLGRMSRSQSTSETVHSSEGDAVRAVVGERGPRMVVAVRATDLSGESRIHRARQRVLVVTRASLSRACCSPVTQFHGVI